MPFVVTRTVDPGQQLEYHGSCYANGMCHFLAFIANTLPSIPSTALVVSLLSSDVSAAINIGTGCKLYGTTLRLEGLISFPNWLVDDLASSVGQ